MLLNKKIPLKYIANKIKFDVLYVFTISVVTYFLTHKFSHFFPTIPLTIPAFMGTSISILLSFKLNQSYERWWEARKIGGSIVNDSRSFVIQLQTLIKGQDKLIEKMAYRQIAWCYVLASSLRKQDVIKNVKHLLSEEDLTYINRHSNKPLALIQLHGIDLSKLNNEKKLELFSQLHIDNTLVKFCVHMGKAERIKNTVFPITYRMFLHLIIYIFIVTLSIGLTNTNIYFETSLLLLISSAFFLLEKTATHMQDPFENRPTDTAMTSISKTIEINIKQLLSEDVFLEEQRDEKFYVL